VAPDDDVQTSDDKDSAAQRAQEFRERQEKAKEEIKELEKQDELPSDPKDWPDGPAKYQTIDGEGEDPYGEGITAKLGPPSVEHHEDGSVSVEGDKVDDPDEFKGEPIPGGPTDPQATRLAGEDDVEVHEDDDKSSDSGSDEKSESGDDTSSDSGDDEKRDDEG
jgi:hypothetical protein